MTSYRTSIGLYTHEFRKKISKTYSVNKRSSRSNGLNENTDTKNFTHLVNQNALAEI